LRFRVALAVPKLSESIVKNQELIISFINEAAHNHSDLVIFPECAVTGLIDNGEFGHDRIIACSIGDAFYNRLRSAAMSLHIRVVIGILEQSQGKLYDSVLFFNKDGSLSGVYRRISKWNWNPEYCVGTEIPVIDSDIGRFAFLLCGDLFYQNVVDELKKLNFDYLLYPVAVSFDGEPEQPQELWKVEICEYRRRIIDIGKMTFMTNYIAPEEHEYKCFGGAQVFDEEGNILCCRDILQPGLLYFDVH
jgi:predicted amidohydrolase